MSMYVFQTPDRMDHPDTFGDFESDCFEDCPILGGDSIVSDLNAIFNPNGIPSDLDNFPGVLGMVAASPTGPNTAPAAIDYIAPRGQSYYDMSFPKPVTWQVIDWLIETNNFTVYILGTDFYATYRSRSTNGPKNDAGDVPFSASLYLPDNGSGVTVVGGAKIRVSNGGAGWPTDVLGDYFLPNNSNADALALSIYSAYNDCGKAGENAVPCPKYVSNPDRSKF